MTHRSTPRTVTGRLLGLMTALVVVLAGAVPAVAAVDSGTTRVIVREAVSSDAPEAYVARVGGDVVFELNIIGGFVADIPTSSIATLAAMADVEAVTPDASVDLEWQQTYDPATYTAKEYQGSIYNVVRKGLKADDYWEAGYTGKGVDIALIDSGVVPVDGLDSADKVVNGPDLSFDSQIQELRYLDAYGHGTHLAGIMAGKDHDVTNPAKASPDDFVGVAPDARVLNVRVADHRGAVDVSQVIAAIDWVVEHKNDNGLNVRVINLSFGTDGVQSYKLDPLAFAVEQAWHNGIVVVVSAGNDGNDALLRNPATDPFVIAVGSLDPGDKNYDYVSSFSNCGSPDRFVDITAPGKSILSLRNPGSYADQTNPNARVEGRLFLGSGTSQAAAAISGAAALIVQQHPDATPDQVKALLMGTAHDVKASKLCQGAGRADLKAALAAPLPKAAQSWSRSYGSGSLEASRGSAHLQFGDSVLEGEEDIFGKEFNSEYHAKLSFNGSSWSGGEWNGSSWSGSSWSGSSWSGSSWSGISWSGSSWSGSSWSANAWSGSSWSGSSWSGSSWSGSSWSGISWSGNSWSGTSWSTDVWQGAGWGAGAGAGLSWD